MRRAYAVVVALAGVASCRLPTSDGPAYAGPRNRCDAGCPSDATCVDNACVADVTDYELVLEATPPTTAAHGPGLTFSIPVDDRRGGARPLQLPEVAQVSARVTAATAVPVVMTLTRTNTQPGVVAVYTARSAGADQTRTLNVPPGAYEVRLEPENAADLARYPPLVLRDDAKKVPLALTLTAGPQLLVIGYGGTFRSFEVSLVDEKGAPVTSPTMAYDVSVVDAVRGQLVSTRVSTCTTPGAPLASKVTLALAPDLEGEHRVLRLEPARVACTAATGSALPTFEYDLAALDVEGRGKAELTLPTLKPVVATADVYAVGAPSQTLASRVIFRSTSLVVPDGVRVGTASFVARGETDAGRLTLALLPGTYTADVVPSPLFNERARAFSTCTTCPVPSQDPASKPGDKTKVFSVEAGTNLVFELSRRGRLRARAVGFDSALFPLGTFEAAAVGSASALPRTQLGSLVLATDRTTGDVWNVDGDLDVGLYDLVVRVPEASGYPWLVAPRLTVAGALDAGVLTMAAPVVFTGTIVDPAGGRAGHTVLRARATVLDRTTRLPVGSVIVGEARADEGGTYRLVVPSKLAGVTTKT